MEKIAIKIQKILPIIIVVSFLIMAIYALGMATPSAVILNWEGTVDGVKSTDFYDAIQPINNTILILAIIGIVISLCFSILRNNIRKIYYVSNFVWFGVYFAITIFSAIYTFIGVSTYQNAYSKIPFAEVNQYFADRNLSLFVNENTPIFILGYVVAIILLLTLIPAVILLINKIKTSIAWKNHLKEIEQEEAK